MIEKVNGVVVRWLPLAGPLLGSEASAIDLMGENYGMGVDLFAVPVERLDPEFFRLASGVAGAFVQKLQNYGYRLAVIGGVPAGTRASDAWLDFVRETNRHGRHLFVADEPELRARLRP